MNVEFDVCIDYCESTNCFGCPFCDCEDEECVKIRSKYNKEEILNRIIERIDNV